MASSASTLDRVKYYPMVLLVCYFWGMCRCASLLHWLRVPYRARDVEGGLIVFGSIVCECAASVNRIMQIFGPPVFWVTVLHTIGKINHISLCCLNPSYVVMSPSLIYIPTAGGTGAASQGTLNAFVYGLTPSVRSAGAEILRGYGLCLPRHEFARTETSSSNAPATSAKSAAVDDSESAHPVAVADSFR